MLTWLAVLQGGNNNTYCHDSPLNWFDWTQAEEDASGFARFFRLLVNLRYARAPPDSPKTLIMHGSVCASSDASFYFLWCPRIVWLAGGGCLGLSEEKGLSA